MFFLAIASQAVIYGNMCLKKKKHGFSALPVMARFCPEAVFSGHMMFL